MFLGRGTYGSVHSENNTAVKKFYDIRHLTQEYIAGSRMEFSDNVVQIYDVDLMNLTLTMELFEMNLREWMERNKYNSRYHSRMFILHEMIVGLVEIHEQGLVHGDIKPGNILMNDSSEKDLKVVIGDLGFLSLDRYAKIKYTARVYRDQGLHQMYSHDIYSLAIIMIELFGFLRIKKPMSSDELKRLCQLRIKSTKMQNIIHQMLHIVPDKRPKAKDILEKLYREKIDIPLVSFPFIEDTTFCSETFALMRKLGTKYHLAKIDRCVQGLQFYTQTHDVKNKHCKIYGICMLLISSSIYRITRFTLSKALRYSENKIEIFLKYYCELLANNDIIDILMFNK